MAESGSKSKAKDEFKKFISNVKDKINEEGNDDVLAYKMARKINSGFKSQISSLEGSLPDLEDLVDDAKDAYNNAKYPVKFTDQQTYFATLKSAKEKLTKAEHNLEDVESTIALRKEQYKEIIG